LPKECKRYTGYGAVTFLVLLFDLFLIPALFRHAFRDENWKVWKELLFLLFILFTIGLANQLYTSWLYPMTLTWANTIVFQVFTMAIGIIPITTLTIVKQNYLHRKNRIGAEQLSASIQPRTTKQETISDVHFASDNGKDEISIPVADLLAVNAEGNYITVFYTKDEKPYSNLLRNTLAYAEKAVSSNPAIFKCHRSYLVNLDRVTKVTGNSQGYRLVLDGALEKIPVSRSNAARLKEFLSN